VDLITILTALGGLAGVGSLITTLYLLQANRDQAEAEARRTDAEAQQVLAGAEKIMAESDLSDAQAAEKFTAVAMIWIKRLEDEVVKLRGEIEAQCKTIEEQRKQIRDLQAERAVLISRVAEHEQQLKSIVAERDALQARVSELERRLANVIEERDELRDKLECK
jgi:chromosome segregation ATPase